MLLFLILNSCIIGSFSIDLIKKYQKYSNKIAHPSQQVCVGPGYKLICGGARVEWNGSGNMLTASHPVITKNSVNGVTSQCWYAKSKDHLYSDPSILYVYAVGIYDPYDKLDIRVWKHTSAKAPHPRSDISVANGYNMLCGGANVNWEETGGSGNLLFASYPSSFNSWGVSSKDHLVSNPSSINSYIIGVKMKDGSNFFDHYQIQQNTLHSSKTAHPSVSVLGGSTQAGWYTYGGGAYVKWSGAGNLLYSIYPSSTLDRYICESKDHVVSDPSIVYCYSFSIRKKIESYSE